MNASSKTTRRRLNATTLFVVVALAVLVAAFVIAALGMHLAGGPDAYNLWLTAATPWFLLWRVALYSVGGTLYIAHWRRRLRAAQRDQADGGEAARQRLVRLERMLIVALIAIEATNVPDVIAWLSGG